MTEQELQDYLDAARAAGWKVEAMKNQPGYYRVILAGQKYSTVMSVDALADAVEEELGLTGGGPGAGGDGTTPGAGAGADQGYTDAFGYYHAFTGYASVRTGTDARNEPTYSMQPQYGPAQKPLETGGGQYWDTLADATAAAVDATGLTGNRQQYEVYIAGPGQYGIRAVEPALGELTAGGVVTLADGRQFQAVGNQLYDVTTKQPLAAGEVITLADGRQFQQVGGELMEVTKEPTGAGEVVTAADGTQWQQIGGQWKEVTKQPTGVGQTVTMADGTQWQQLDGQWREVTPEQQPRIQDVDGRKVFTGPGQLLPEDRPNLEAQAAAAYQRKDMDTFNRLNTILNQPTAFQQSQMDIDRARLGLDVQGQALDIAQSPGDWWTYMSRLYGKDLGTEGYPRAFQGVQGDLARVTGQVTPPVATTTPPVTTQPTEPSAKVQPGPGQPGYGGYPMTLDQEKAYLDTLERQGGVLPLTGQGATTTPPAYEPAPGEDLALMEWEAAQQRAKVGGGGVTAPPVTSPTQTPGGFPIPRQYLQDGETWERDEEGNLVQAGTQPPVRTPEEVAAEIARMTALQTKVSAPLRYIDEGQAYERDEEGNLVPVGTQQAAPSELTPIQRMEQATQAPSYRSEVGGIPVVIPGQQPQVFGAAGTTAAPTMPTTFATQPDEEPTYERDEEGNLVPTFRKMPGLRRGTRGFRGGWAMVGEAGPELMKLPKGARVMPITPLQFGTERRGYGPTGWASPGLAQAEATGLIQPERARALPTVFGAEGKVATPFLSMQQWGKLLPSEQSMWMAENRARGFPQEDYMTQWQRQAGRAGFASRPGPQAFGGAGGRLSIGPRAFR